MQIPDYRDAEIEGLIREYKKNTKPTQSAMQILEFYGGEDCRTNKGAEMRRCIQRLVEEERNLESVNTNKEERNPESKNTMEEERNQESRNTTEEERNHESQNTKKEERRKKLRK